LRTYKDNFTPTAICDNKGKDTLVHSELLSETCQNSNVHIYTSTLYGAGTRIHTCIRVRYTTLPVACTCTGSLIWTRSLELPAVSCIDRMNSLIHDARANCLHVHHIVLHYIAGLYVCTWLHPSNDRPTWRIRTQLVYYGTR
jgi:hypothetical protein